MAKNTFSVSFIVFLFVCLFRHFTPSQTLCVGVVNSEVWWINKIILCYILNLKMTIFFYLYFSILIEFKFLYTLKNNGKCYNYNLTEFNFEKIWQQLYFNKCTLLFKFDFWKVKCVFFSYVFFFFSLFIFFLHSRVHSNELSPTNFFIW